MHTLETYGPVLGRILLGLLFLVTGLDKVVHFADTGTSCWRTA
jgi:hypothetical protein